MIRNAQVPPPFPPHVALVAALLLAGCQGIGGVRPATGLNPAPSGAEFGSGEQDAASWQELPTTAAGSGAASSGEPVVVDDNGSNGAPATLGAVGSATDAGGKNEAAGAHGVDTRERRLPAVHSIRIGTSPGSVRQAELPRDNPTASDLLDHWGHRQTHAVTGGLSLAGPADGADAAALTRLQTAAGTDDGAPVAPDLQDGDGVRILGARRGVTYGRWTGGPADTLSIEFDVSRAGRQVRNDSDFRPMLERAGKVWSHRIADTWATWERRAGESKGFFINGGNHDPVYVGSGGETSVGLEIDLKDADLEVAGWANEWIRPPGDSWEPRFGSIEFDRDHLREAGERLLFGNLIHEIGHVLGAWQGGTKTERYAPYTDTEAGTWTGPNVVAVHGGPAPFQDSSDPKGWVDGERDPLALEYDFAHSGVCASVMAYCRDGAAAPAFLPHAIDFAFLADLGVTVIDETDRPETYGFAGWTEHAAFTLSVSRNLRVTLADPQPYYDRTDSPWYWSLDVTDLLEVGVEAFGYRTTGGLGTSYPLAESLGTVWYAGNLIGAAIGREGMPPVTGDASLEVDVGNLDGTASFTSLALHARGAAETFAGGVLQYPFELSDNAIVGTRAESTLLADFYGPAHEDVAGTLRDPRAGLLASFGATVDNRPEREYVIAAADYLAGWSVRTGASDEIDNGWFEYRCNSRSSCEIRDDEANRWNNWSAGTLDSVLASTAGWDWRDTARRVGDRDFVRIARQSAATTDGARGRHVVDGYTGTMEHSAFGIGFERYSNEWADSTGTPGGLYERWTGVQGTVSGRLPDARAQWSGLMLGYDRDHAASEHPFVEGVATVDYHLSTNRVNVAFSDVASRDGQRKFADFSFTNIQPQADGKFASTDRGLLYGAFFGSANQEAAGTFTHRATLIFGSFGAQPVPDTVRLEVSGTVWSAGTTTDDSGAQIPFFAYDDWGFWGRQFDNTLFGAFLEQATTQSDNTTTYYAPTTRVSGTRTRSNPVSGEAVWTGSVRAFDTSQADFLPVSGAARLEVDFDDATVDVEFSNFDEGHAHMSWQGLGISGGAFQDTQTGATIEGAFYGSEHQGVAGTFDRGSLKGVFGAVRN